MRTILLSLLLLVFAPWASTYALATTNDSTAGFVTRPLPASSPDPQGAERHKQLAELAFARKDYAEALRHYHHVFLTYPTAAVYYNMALCHSNMGQVHDAILAYERALLEEPTMPEARHNLRLMYATTKDGLSDGRALRSIDDFCYQLPASTLSWIVVGLWLFMLLSFLVFRLGTSIMSRRWGFYAFLLFTAMWLLTLAMLAHQYYYQGIAQRRAIINTTQELKPTPTGQGNTIAILHEGTAIILKGEALGHWQEVSLGDGRTGWLPITTFTTVVPQKTLATQ